MENHLLKCLINRAEIIADNSVSKSLGSKKRGVSVSAIDPALLLINLFQTGCYFLHLVLHTQFLRNVLDIFVLLAEIYRFELCQVNVLETQSNHINGFVQFMF